MSTELSTPWIVTLASTIVAVLASVVAFLFKLNESKSVKAVENLELHVTGLRDRIEKLDDLNRECIQDRVRLQTLCEVFEKRLTQLEVVSCGVSACESRRTLPIITGEQKHGGE
jgi:hypothetical protein